MGFPSHSTTASFLNAVHTPQIFLPAVWPLPLSLATTHGISVDYFSSAYLDVSVRRVPSARLCIHRTVLHRCRRFPHSDIHGYIDYLRLPVAFRSLSRPSSAPDAKAFPLCSFSLELLSNDLSFRSFLHELRKSVFLQNCFLDLPFFWKDLSSIARIFFFLS